MTLCIAIFWIKLIVNRTSEQVMLIKTKWVGKSSKNISENGTNPTSCKELNTKIFEATTNQPTTNQTQIDRK